MIYSMTGFATAAKELDTGSLTLELRAVNHRYLDLQIRIPDELIMLESALRETLATQLTRGRVDLRISFVARHSDHNPAQLNPTLLRQLAQWSKQIKTALPEATSLGVADVLQWNGMLHTTALPADTLQAAALELLKNLLREFGAVREREGEKLKTFLLQRVAHIAVLCASVAPRIPGAIAAYEEKLGSRLRLILQNDYDDRLRQEISLFASKVDVDEELSRLQIHLAEIKRVLAQGGAVGKRLDFLVQELHREANTLGSKSVDAEVSRAAMEIKLLIEQMREQIQNIE